MTFNLPMLIDKHTEETLYQDAELLMPGNRKLGRPSEGKTIWHFDLPSVFSCLASAECLKECYAHGKLFSFHQTRYALNLEISQTADFVSKIQEEINRKDVEILRPHVSGDFYSVEYCHKWLEIFDFNPELTFYLYTRSWQDQAMRSVFELMARLKNVHIWYSVDRSMMRPIVKHKRIRTCYMLAADEKEPVYPANLIFRVNSKSIAKKINGVQVCPYEQGVERKVSMTCNKCNICLREGKRNV